MTQPVSAKDAQESRRALDVLQSRPRPRFSATDRLAYLLITPSAVVLLLILLVPLLFNLFASTQRWILFGAAPRFIGLKNYITIFDDPQYLQTIGRTALFVFVTVGLQFILGFAVALLLDRYLHRLRLAQIIFLLPMMISEVAAALGWRLILTGQFSFVNWLVGLVGIPPQVWLGPKWAFASVVTVEVWQQTPFVILLLFAALQGVPQEIVEASKLDGAGGWQAIRHITIPLIQPAVLVTLMFRTMFALRAFGTIWTLTQGGPASRTTILGIEIYQLAFGSFDLGMSSALAVLLTVLSAAISVAYIRFLSRESLM